MKTTRLRPFEHALWLRFERDRVGPGTRALVACSGGRDSMALLRALAAAAPRAGVELAAAHVHHGPGLSPDRDLARDQARVAAERAARSLGLRFHVRERDAAPEGLKSEADLREYRLRSLAEIARAEGCAAIALAHHADDLLETRLIRLARGTGPDGLEAMRARNGVWWRPLLETPRSEIDAYARALGLECVEDPSNADDGPLRNWMRLRWLPEIERKRPGSAQALARSLELLAERVRAEGGAGAQAVDSSGSPAEAGRSAEIERSAYRDGTERGKTLALLRALREVGALDVTRSRLEEVRKRLASPRRSYVFVVGGVRWSVSPERIRLERGQ